MRYVEAPTDYRGSGPSVFLAGGITGTADWQAAVVDALSGAPVDLLNPRRANFPIDDPSAAEGQIRWEHVHLRRADAVLFWFAPSETQPIALYELGAWSMGDKPIFVGCDPAYPRIVDVVVQTKLVRPEVEVVYSLDDLVAQVRGWLAPRAAPATRTGVVVRVADLTEKALGLAVHAAKAEGEWDEEKHPRAANGQFGSGGGEASEKKPRFASYDDASGAAFDAAEHATAASGEARSYSKLSHREAAASHLAAETAARAAAEMAPTKEIADRATAAAVHHAEQRSVHEFSDDERQMTPERGFATLGNAARAKSEDAEAATRVASRVDTRPSHAAAAAAHGDAAAWHKQAVLLAPDDEARSEHEKATSEHEARASAHRESAVNAPEKRYPATDNGVREAARDARMASRLTMDAGITPGSRPWTTQQQKAVQSHLLAADAHERFASSLRDEGSERSANKAADAADDHRFAAGYHATELANAQLPEEPADTKDDDALGLHYISNARGNAADRVDKIVVSLPNGVPHKAELLDRTAAAHDEAASLHRVAAAALRDTPDENADYGHEEHDRRAAAHEAKAAALREARKGLSPRDVPPARAPLGQVTVGEKGDVRAVVAEPGKEAEAERLIQSVAKNPAVHAMLREHPLPSLHVKDLGAEMRSVGGSYDMRDGTLTMNARLARPYGMSLARCHSFSGSAPTEEEAHERTLVHELGHHLSTKTPDARADGWFGRPKESDGAITTYATTNPEEYFAENFAAYHYAPDTLRVLDPNGYRMIERAMRQVVGD